jgi:hypothetical protein
MIGVEKAREMIEATIKRHPRKTNPVSNTGECLYTKGKRHCLIGQMLVDHGLPCPGPEVIAGVAEVWEIRRLFSSGALRLLMQGQSMADCGTPWGYVRVSD